MNADQSGKHNASVPLQSNGPSDQVKQCSELIWWHHSSLGSSFAGVMTAAEGQKALAQHAASMGRFGLGAGAFLTPLYGGSEMSQAFCRVAAVHGALYVLRQPIDALLMDPEAADEPDAARRCRGVQLSTGQVIPLAHKIAGSLQWLSWPHRLLHLRACSCRLCCISSHGTEDAT